MSTEHVKATSGDRHVLVLSQFSQRHDRNQGRPCGPCGAVWHVEFKTEGRPTVWKDGEEAPDSVLDWTGNNVAVQCCSPARGA